MQAKKDAWMAANGWDRLSWEEQKRLGLMGRGMFRMSADEITGGSTRTGVVTTGMDPLETSQPTRQFNPELPVTGARGAQPYRGEGASPTSWWGQQAEQFNPEPKPQPEPPASSSSYRGDGAGRTDAINMPNFKPELKPKPDRKSALYQAEKVIASIDGESMVVLKSDLDKATAAATPAPKGKGKGKAKAATTAEAQAAKQALADIPKARAELAKQLEELRKKSQGGSC